MSRAHAVDVTRDADLGLIDLKGAYGDDAPCDELGAVPVRGADGDAAAGKCDAFGRQHAAWQRGELPLHP